MHQVWNWVSRYTQGHMHELQHVGWNVFKILILLIVAKVLVSTVCRVVARLLRLRTKIDERRRNTLEALIQNVVKYSVYFILLLTILPIFGVHIEALLAGAGVAGIAIAFGAQSLLKDFFNGLFILFEDQYGVGDYVMINGSTSGITGQVRTIGLRITVIKIWTGELVVIPNGQITQVTNYSKENSIAVIDVHVGFQTDTELAVSIVWEVMQALKKSEKDIIGDVDVLGVQAVTDSAYTIRATAECAPYGQFGITRLAQQRIYKAFAAAGVATPTQKVVYMQDSPSPDTFSDNLH